MDRRAKLTHRQKCGMLAAENCNCSAFSLRRKRMGKLFAAKLHARKGASHDNSSTAGLRVSEAVCLKVRDIDSERMVITWSSVISAAISATLTTQSIFRPPS